jgi:arylsulfatase A-like enzyme
MLRRILDSPRTYYILAGLLLLGGLFTQFELRPPARPLGTADDLATLRERDDVNVLFILIDTLRSDRLGAYGQERPTSPWMDHLASTGVLFNRVVAQSTWTKSSMASLWTGTYPVRNGILRWGHGLPEEAVMPAEIFQEAGFTTTAIYRNGWVAPNFGFSQGFDSYIRPDPNRLVKRRSPRAHVALEGTDEDLTVSGLEFLRSNRDRRFLLYMHYMDVHQYTYVEGSALFGNSYLDAYDNAIHWTDQNVGILVRELDELGIRDKTIIVIGSDHGEEFLEHGFEGHAKNLYRETVQVPWIMSLPFRLETPVVIDTMVENIDMWPTLLDLLGLPALPSADGKSQVPLIDSVARGGQAPEGTDGLVISHLDRRWGHPNLEAAPTVSVMEGTHRVIRTTADDMEIGLELYDYAADAAEQENLATIDPERAEELGKNAAEYLQLDKVEWGSPVDVEIDDLQAGQLRALGYVVR